MRVTVAECTAPPVELVGCPIATPKKVSITTIPTDWAVVAGSRTCGLGGLERRRCLSAAGGAPRRILWNRTQRKVDRMIDAGELSEPVQEGSGDATREQKIAGLVRQVAADIALKPREFRGQEAVLNDLRLRLADAGIAIEEDELLAIASTISFGG